MRGRPATTRWSRCSTPRRRRRKTPSSVCFPTACEPLPAVRTATARRSSPRVSSATWWSTGPVPEAPAALEVHAPAAQAEPADAPALARDDGAQEPQRVGAVAVREQAVQVQEEARLVAGGDLRVAPDRRGGREVRHAGGAGEAASGRPCRRGRRSRWPRRCPSCGSSAPSSARSSALQRAVAGAARVGDEQHRLHDAGRGEDAVEAVAVDARRRAHGEGDRAGAGRGVAARGRRPAASTARASVELRARCATRRSRGAARRRVVTRGRAAARRRAGRRRRARRALRPPPRALRAGQRAAIASAANAARRM